MMDECKDKYYDRWMGERMWYHKLVIDRYKNMLKIDVRRVPFQMDGSYDG